MGADATILCLLGFSPAWNLLWTWWTGQAFQQSVPNPAVERSVKCQPRPATITITAVTACTTTTTIEMKKDHRDR
jgi:hypothetical protein